jgi:hypothetical protein
VKVKRHLVALAATAALVGAGSSQAVACGDSCGPNVASQSASNSQILPISLGLGAAVPVNANVPVSVLSAGPGQGAVNQESRANGSASSTNNGTVQSVRQQGTGGGNSASQSASNSQILPIAAAIGAAIPVNANVPVSVLSGGATQGVVNQRANANAGAEALNNDLNQSVEHCGDSCGPNVASQSASNSQILPIALGLGAAVPVNANVPVAVLSGGPKQGAVNQRADADANGEALNNETEQTIRQEAAKGDGGNSASQSASNSQILPIALGAALAIPINANIPIAVLSGGPVQGDVNQHSDGNARSRAANLEHDQDIVQRGGKGSNSASQSASNSQILPIALGAALAIPINLNVPISILSTGPVQGAVNQRGDADANAEALNNETEQTIRQDGRGGANQAQQSASSSQILPIALGAALAIPINVNLPISILSAGPAQGDVTQKGDADANAEAINYELDQSAQQGEGQDAKQSQSGGGNAGASGSAGQSAPSAGGSGPVSAATPVGILPALPLPLGIVEKLLSTVQATLADPVGTLMAVLKDPIGSVTGLVSSLLSS